MSLNEEESNFDALPSTQLQQIEGDEIQTIAYDDNNFQNNDKDGFAAKDKIVKDNNNMKKKSRIGLDKSNGSTVAEDVNPMSCNSSGSYDICRICHMGDANRYNRINCASSNEQNVVSSRNSSSFNLDLGNLVSACRCRGTVGLVHTKCLERWLTGSGHTHCELCGYRFSTVRVPKHGFFRSLLIWIKTFVATRQMLLDSLYLIVTTPLAVFSAYVCAMTLKMALENRIGEIPWTIIAMLPTCSLTLVAYWGWLLTLQRLHGRRWNQYWQSNFIVRLVPNDPNAVVDQNYIEETDMNHEDLYEEFPDLFNLL